MTICLEIEDNFLGGEIQKMKRIISIALVLCMITTLLVGCNQKPNDEGEIATVYRTAEEWQERWQAAEYQHKVLSN